MIRIRRVDRGWRYEGGRAGGIRNLGGSQTDKGPSRAEAWKAMDFFGNKRLDLEGQLALVGSEN